MASEKKYKEEYVVCTEGALNVQSKHPTMEQAEAARDAANKAAQHMGLQTRYVAVER